MWGAIIGDMVGASFAGKLNNNYRFETAEHFGGYTVNTLLVTALEEYLSYAPTPPSGRIAVKLAEREIGGIQKKYLQRSAGLCDEPRKRWISSAGLRRTIAVGAFAPVLALPLAVVCDDVEQAAERAEQTCAYISDCAESREAARAGAVLLYSLMHGIDKTELNEICEPFCGFAPEVPYAEIQETLSEGGGVREYVQGAVAALVKSYDFDSAVRFAAALGREPQTVCALAGAMAEAYYKEIPPELAEKAMNGLEIHERTKVKNFMKKTEGKYLTK